MFSPCQDMVPQARTARVLEAMSAAFYSLDTDWRFTYVNAEAERLLDRPREELLGGVLWDLVPAALSGVVPGTDVRYSPGGKFSGTVSDPFWSSYEGAAESTRSAQHPRGNWRQWQGSARPIDGAENGARADEVGSRKRVVRDENRAIRAHRQRLAQCIHRASRAHRHQDDFAPA